MLICSIIMSTLFNNAVSLTAPPHTPPRYILSLARQQTTFVSSGLSYITALFVSFSFNKLFESFIWSPSHCDAGRYSFSYFPLFIFPPPRRKMRCWSRPTKVDGVHWKPSVSMVTTSSLIFFKVLANVSYSPNCFQPLCCCYFYLACCLSLQDLPLLSCKLRLIPLSFAARSLIYIKQM